MKQPDWAVSTRIQEEKVFTHLSRSSFSHFGILFLSLLFNLHSLSAQHRLWGAVADEQGQALAYANVLVLQAGDSSLVRGEISGEDGSFVFEQLPAGDYLLRVSAVGYAGYDQPLGRFDSDRELPGIRLATASTLLQTVEITARKPFLEQKAGTLVVNVADAIVGADGTAIQLLQKVPGIVVVQDQIRLAGRSGVTILIDGRPTQYVDVQALLRDMPAGNIQRIEVVSQPGAKYDAQGTGGVINFILKKNVKLGSNGSFTLGAGQGKFTKYRASGALNYRNGKINLSNSLAFNHRTSYEELWIDRRIGEERYNQINRQPYLPYSLNLRSGIDYYLSERQTTGFSINLLGSTQVKTDDNITAITGTETPGTIDLNTTNRHRRRWGYLSADAYYQLKFDTSGHELNFDASFSQYGRLNRNLVQTQTQDLPAELYPDRQQNMPGNSTITAAKVDYQFPFNDWIKLEAGGKISHAEIDNDMRAQVLREDVWVNDPGLSNHFLFDETIAAAYVSAGLTKEKWEAKFGLRYEDANTTGNSLTLDSITRRQFRQLFPTASLSATLVGKFGAALAYSYRIDRPNYNFLNPFIEYLDPYTFRKGNPFLKPELTHSMQFSVTYDKQPFFNLEYNRASDVIRLVTEQNDETGEAFGTYLNLQTHERMGGSLFFPLNFVKKLSGYGGGMLFYNRYRSEGLFNADLDQARWNFVGFLQATYQFSKRWKAEVNGWYSGPGVEGLLRNKGLFSLSAGVQTTLLNEQATLRLNCDDLLFRFWRGQIRHSNLNMDLQSRWETRVVNMSFTYNFGNQHLKKGNRRSSSSEEERQRTQENGK